MAFLIKASASPSSRLREAIVAFWRVPKWAKINEKLEKRACGTLKINDLIDNAAVRVENAHQNGQTRHNTTLLGKYRFRQRDRPRGKFYDRGS